MPEVVDSGLTLGVLAGRLRRLKKLAEIVNRDDLAGTLQGVLDELEWSLEDATIVDPELLKSLRNRIQNPLSR